MGAYIDCSTLYPWVGFLTVSSFGDKNIIIYLLKGALGLTDLETTNLRYLGSTTSLQRQHHRWHFYPSLFCHEHTMNLPHFCT
jgi:hypothetical protein